MLQKNDVTVQSSCPCLRAVWWWRFCSLKLEDQLVMATLPPELWTKIFRFATLPELENVTAASTGFKSAICANDEVPIMKVLPDGAASIESYAQFRTKRTLLLINRPLNFIAKEFLFEILFIPNEHVAESLAEMVDGLGSSDIRNRARQIVISTSSQVSSASCLALTAAVVRIISKLHRLELFYLRWKTPRACEERVVDALPPSIKHFEWHNPGGGFSRSPTRSLSQFLRRIRDNLEVLHLSGYLPLPGPANSVDAYDGEKCEFPYLKQLNVKREFYCDLHLISAWVTSDNLTCLSLGTFWSYPKLRDPQCAFFKVQRPSLQCLHLGKSARISPKLLRTIFKSATHLQCLEYVFAGDSDSGDWEGIEHLHLRTVEAHLLRPWDVRSICSHLRPFARTELPQADGQPLHFPSLSRLKLFARRQIAIQSQLESSVRGTMAAATAVALEFEDDAA